MTIGIFLTQDNPDWFTFLVLEEEEKGTGIDHKKSSTLGNRDIHRYLHASKRSVTTIKGIARSPRGPRGRPPPRLPPPIPTPPTPPLATRSILQWSALPSEGDPERGNHLSIGSIYVARSRRGGWRSTGDSADPRPAKTIRMSNDGITIALAAANSGVTCFPAKFQIARAAKGDYNQPGPGSEISELCSEAEGG